MFSEFLSLANRTYVSHIQKEIRITCQIGYDVLFVRSNKLLKSELAESAMKRLNCTLETIR